MWTPKKEKFQYAYNTNNFTAFSIPTVQILKRETSIGASFSIQASV